VGEPGVGILTRACGGHAPTLRRGTFGRGGVPSMSSGEHTPRHLERRWATRYLFRAELEIEWGSAVLRGKTRDISSNGMFIESADTLWVGAGFTARLAVERPVQMDCSVKRVEPGRGMAVTVTVPEEQHQRRYQDLIASLTPPQT
jgi:PilZ domain